jgi:hypothetical protein
MLKIVIMDEKALPSTIHSYLLLRHFFFVNLMKFLIKYSLLLFLQGVVAYAILNIVVAALIILGTIIFIIFRYCTCCCGPEQCESLKCGSSWPTRKRGCCQGGFRELKDGTLGYTQCEKLTAYIFLGIFLGFLICMIVVANILGTYSLSKNLATAVNAPSPIASFIQEQTLSLAPFLQVLCTDAIIPLISGLNKTLNTAIDLVATAGALATVVTTVNTLPNVTLVLATIYSVQSATNAVSSSVSTIANDLSSLTSLRSTVVSSANSVISDLSGLTYSFTGMSTSLANSSSVLSSVSSYQTQLVGNSNSLVPSIISDLTALQQSPQGSFPASSVFTSAIGSSNTSPGTMLELLSGNALGNPTDISSLVTKLQGISTSLSSLPNYTITANNLLMLNSTLMSIQGGGSGSSNGLIGSLRASIAGLQSSLNSTQKSTLFAGDVNTLLSNVLSVSTYALQQHLVSVNNQLRSISPSLTLLSGFINTTSNLPVILPAILTLTNQLQSVNRSIATLPSSLNDVIALYNSLNSTIMSTLSQISTINGYIFSANNTLNSVNISSYLSLVSSLNSTIISQINQFNVSSLNSTLASLTSGLTFNFSSIYSAINSFSQSLSSAYIDPALVSTLVSFQNNKTAFVSLLNQVSSPATGSYVLLSKGYCSLSVSTYCSVTADCSGSGTCLGNGVYRCSGAGQTIPCTQNSDCSSVSGSVCLADATVGGTILSYLTAASQPNAVPSLGSILTQLNSIYVSTSSSSFPITSYQSNINSISAAINSNSVSSYSNTLSSLVTSVNGFDLSGINSSLTSAQSTINAIPFNSFIPTIQSVQSSITSLTVDKMPLILNLQSFVQSLRDFLTNPTQLYSIIKKLSNIASYALINGTGTMVTIALNEAERAINFLNQSQSFISIPNVDIVSLLSNIDAALDRAAATGDYIYLTPAINGALNYLLSILGYTNTVIMSPLYPYLNGVFLDSVGRRYPSNAYCVTDECATVTANAITSSPPNTWSSQIPDIPASSIPAQPFTLEYIMLGLWVFPFLVLVFGFLAFLCPMCAKAPEWQKLPASWMIGLIICQAPIIFILAGVVFPALLVSGDICSTGPNVGVNYAFEYGNALCVSLGGNGTLESCSIQYPFSIPYTNASASIVNLNLQQIISGVLAKCPSNGQDPVRQVVQNLGALITDIPIIFYQTQVANNAIISKYGISPNVTNLLSNAVDRTSVLIGNFLSNTILQYYTCDRLNVIIQSTVGNSCGTILPSMYFYITAWYLTAWAMCICGLPAGCLMRKRGVVHPWGPVYESTLAAVGKPIPDVGGIPVVRDLSSTSSAIEFGGGPMRQSRYPGNGRGSVRGDHSNTQSFDATGDIDNVQFTKRTSTTAVEASSFAPVSTAGTDFTMTNRYAVPLEQRRPSSVSNTPTLGSSSGGFAYSVPLEPMDMPSTSGGGGSNTNTYSMRNSPHSRTRNFIPSTN